MNRRTMLTGGDRNPERAMEILRRQVQGNPKAEEALRTIMRQFTTIQETLRREMDKHHPNWQTAQEKLRAVVPRRRPSPSPSPTPTPRPMISGFAFEAPLDTPENRLLAQKLMKKVENFNLDKSFHDELRQVLRDPELQAAVEPMLSDFGFF